jgi:hypothetical protein
MVYTKNMENNNELKPATGMERRDQLLDQLRVPSRKADMLIERALGFPNGEGGCRPYTREVEAALSLVPERTHFLCGRFEDGELFWCDVGFRPQVQAWGETMACAIAAAAVAYLTHPEAPGEVATIGITQSRGE